MRQVWQATDVKAHRLKTFRLSKDPRFAEKVIDVVGVYLNPPDNALVLSVDEKTRSRPSTAPHPLLPHLPLRPGQVGAHRAHAEWTQSRLIRWAEQVGPATARLVTRIIESRPHPEQDYRAVLGIMRLGRRHSNARLDAASARALALGSCRFHTVKNIPAAGQDPAAPRAAYRDHPTPMHANWLAKAPCCSVCWQAGGASDRIIRPSARPRDEIESVRSMSMSAHEHLLQEGSNLGSAIGTSKGVGKQLKVGQVWKPG